MTNVRLHKIKRPGGLYWYDFHLAVGHVVGRRPGRPAARDRRLPAADDAKLARVVAEGCAELLRRGWELLDRC